MSTFMSQNAKLSSEDAARSAERNRKHLIGLLYRARDCAPLDEEKEALGLDEDESALIIETFDLMSRIGDRCGIELLPYGWWLDRKRETDYAKFKVLSQRIVMNAVEMTLLDLKPIY